MHKKPETILIADDEFLVQRMLSSMLKESGYTVAGFASSGQEAIEQAVKLKPDAVLMDIKMPGMSGLDACRKLQQQSPVPVVIVSSFDDPQLLQQASDAGAGAYLLKPPTPAALQQALTISCARHDDLQSLLHTNKQLQQALATRDLLFSVIAHDLGTPFMSMNTYIEMTVDNQLDEIKRAELYPILQQKMDELNTLLQELLQWGRSHMQQKQVNKRFTNINMHSLVDELIEQTLSSIQEKQLSVTNDIPGEQTFSGDLQRITIILRNLLNNAIKFTGTHGSITVDTTLNNSGALAINIHDTGTGMNETEISKLFDPRSALSRKGTRGEAGHGLGLLICKDLAEAAGGDLSVHSTPGSGSCFTLTLTEN